MLKVKLVGLLYHKERILNAIQKTGLVEIRATEEIEDTSLITDEA